MSKSKKMSAPPNCTLYFTVYKCIPHYLTLEESVRLLIETKSSSVRDNCIITIFLNCALRLSELAALNIDQVNSDVLTVVGKGNKERKIFITPAVKQASIVRMDDHKKYDHRKF